MICKINVFYFTWREERKLEDSIQIVNALLVNSFNQILTLEKEVLKEGPFSELTITELHAIEAIELKGKTMTETAHKLGITVGSLTVTINRLVKKEYVIRSDKEEDRRMVYLSLTKKGKLAWRLHEHFHRHMVKRMLEGLREDEHQVLIRSLQSLVHFVEEQQACVKVK